MLMYRKGNGEMFTKKTFLMCLAVALMVGVADSSWGRRKKINITELLTDANEIMNKAEEAYLDGESRKALDLYREALQEVDRLQGEYVDKVSSKELAPLRFRRAVCETEIDRIMLEEVSLSSRTVAVTDTKRLQEKRDARRREAETNVFAEATTKLSPKKGTSDGPVGEVVGDDDVKGGEIDLEHELEWAKDMLTVDNFEDAERALIKALRHDPENRDARFLMGVMRVQQERHSDAAVVLADLAEDYPEDEAVLLLTAGAYMASGSYAKAMESLDRAMRANPRRPDGYLNMAWLLLEMNPKEQAEAEMYYRQAVKLGGGRSSDLERRLGIRAE